MLRPDLVHASWESDLHSHREVKDSAFRSRMSPLSTEDRPRFQGLSYFPPNPRYRAVATLQEASPRETVIARSHGDHVFYLRMGTFAVDLPDGRVTLAAYRGANEAPDELFIPFRDGTTGTETYGGGRYLEAHLLPDGTWLLDFNKAYHPYCAYNENLTCPLPPRENWTKVPIRAGERLPETVGPDSPRSA